MAEPHPGAARRQPDGSTTVPMIIVIPVYNEEGILLSSVVSLREHLKELGMSFEIILAENGARDRTVELCRELGEQVPRGVHLLHRPAQLRRGAQGGHPAGARRGTSSATRSTCATSTSTGARWRLLDGDAAMVVGSKVMAGAEDTRPLFRHAATMVYNGMLRVLVGFHGTDTHGLKAFRRDQLVGTAGRCVVDKDVFA